jgi:hypothetical protein
MAAMSCSDSGPPLALLAAAGEAVPEACCASDEVAPARVNEAAIDATARNRGGNKKFRSINWFS